MPPRPYAELLAWQRAHVLALRVSAVCRSLPSHERYDLASQLRRAARSVAANLAEGKGVIGPSLFLRHVQVALGSLAEVDYFLLCARDEGYITHETCDQLADEAWRLRGLLVRLATSLRAAAARR